MFLEYKDLAANNELDESYNNIIDEMIPNKKTVLNVIFNDDYSFLKQFEEQCDDFIGFWCNKNLTNLQEQIKYLSRIENIPNPDHYYTILKKKEIIDTLVEIVSVFTNEESNEFLLDYIEGDQQLLVDSYVLLYTIANISSKAIVFLLSPDIAIIDIICQNFMESYSELTRIAAIDLLRIVILNSDSDESESSEQSLLQLSRYSEFIEFLSNSFLQQSNSQESLASVSNFISSLSRFSKSDKIDCFKESMINVLITIFDMSSDFSETCLCGLFHLMYNNPQLLDFELIDHIISLSSTLDNEITLYYSIEILKLSLLYFKEKEHIDSLISHINLSYLNRYYKDEFHIPLCHVITNFFFLMFLLGPEYIELGISNEIISSMLCAYDESSHSIRNVIIEVVDILFILSTGEQIDYLIRCEAHIILLDSILTQTHKKLMVNALLSLFNHAPELLRDESTINDLSQLFNTVEDQETLEKLSFMLDTITKND